MSEHRAARLDTEIPTYYPCCGLETKLRSTDVLVEVFVRRCPDCDLVWTVTRRQTALESGLRTDRITWELHKGEVPDSDQPDA